MSSPAAISVGLLILGVLSRAGWLGGRGGVRYSTQHLPGAQEEIIRSPVFLSHLLVRNYVLCPFSIPGMQFVSFEKKKN